MEVSTEGMHPVNELPDSPRLAKVGELRFLGICAVNPLSFRYRIG